MKVRYLVIALLLLSFISLFVGVKDITPLDLLNLSDDKVQIMLQSRVPRMVTLDHCWCSDEYRWFNYAAIKPQ